MVNTKVDTMTKKMTITLEDTLIDELASLAEETGKKKHR